MARKDDLENSIRESYDIIRDYEAIVHTSERPEEKARARRVVREQWTNVEKYLAEYYRVTINVADDIAQIAARFTPVAKAGAPSNQPVLLIPREPFEPDMILIPAGEFLMGDDLKTEYLPDYYIAKTPVTSIQYMAFVKAGGKCPRHWENDKIPAGKEHHPVVEVSWYDAVAYCDWLSEVTGKLYRLPTEQEWEKAARGTDGRKWPWGNEWQDGLCNTLESGIKDTTPVGRYSPQGDSPYGLQDMAGNVWEWTASWYDEKRMRRVLRGGGWDFSQDFARCACRDHDSPDLSNYVVGFRCCVAPISGSGS